MPASRLSHAPSLETHGALLSFDHAPLIQTSAAPWEMSERVASGKSPGQLNGQFYYWAWVAILFAFATWQRFALPLDPIGDWDVWGYIAPALRKLVGGEFGHTYGRNFVYPAFVFSLLNTFKDFRAIVIAQHLLGLLAVALFLVTWR